MNFGNLNAQLGAIRIELQALKKRLTLGSGGFPPSAHGASHEEGGSDELDILSLGGFTGSTTDFVRAAGTMATPPGAASGNATYADAYASRPASSLDGNLFFPTDANTFQRDNGSSYPLAFGPIFPLTPPDNSAFSDISGGAPSTITAAKGVITITGSGSVNVRGRTQAVPASTPWTRTAIIIPRMVDSFAHCGVFFRQSSGGGAGKLVTCGLFRSASSWDLTVFKWDNPSTFNFAYSTITPGFVPQPLILQISDTGSNRVCRWSTDGIDFHQLHSVGNTDFLTADEIGFYVDSNGASVAPAMTLLSWA
jgi:hypothetical protein